MVVLVGVVFLVVSEEVVKLNTLFEILDSFETSNMLQEIEVAVDIDTSSDKSMPVNRLELDVRVVFLELEVNSLAKVNVWSFNGMHVFTCHLELGYVEVLWEHLHFYVKYKKLNYNKILNK